MYLLYESLYGDLLQENDSTNIIGLYNTLEKASDIVCQDTGKTRIELDLDMKYYKIMKELNYILVMCGLENNFIENSLDKQEILQSELDSALMELIETIKYED